MKKIKLLLPILGTTSIATMLIPLTSCGDNNSKVTITINAGEGGSVDKTSIDVEKNKTWGEVKSQITVTPKSGFGFNQWQKDGTELADSYKITEKFTATATFKELGSFNGKTWKEVTTAVSKFEQITTPTVNDAVELCKAVGKAEPTEGATVEETLETNLVGLEGKITINGVENKIVCIDTMHDQLSNNADKKASMTFQLTTLFSDNEGKYMGTHMDETNNYDYLNSTFRATLNGSGEGKIGWYRYNDSMEEEKLSETRSALEIIMEENPSLGASIKEVSKDVSASGDSGSTYITKNYTDKLFPLTYTEMGLSTDVYVQPVGSVYKWWNEHKTKEDRIKTSNDGEAKEYWLSSPRTNSNAAYKTITENGLESDSGCFHIEAITFAFCI